MCQSMTSIGNTLTSWKIQSICLPSKSSIAIFSLITPQITRSTLIQTRLSLGVIKLGRKWLRLFFEVSEPIVADSKIDEKEEAKKAAALEQRAAKFVDEFFAKFDKDKNGELVRDELPRVVERFKVQ